MKKITLGKKPGIHNLKSSNFELPEIGRRDVLLRMQAASLNYRDLEIINGTYGEKFKPGLVPLSDGAGDVIQTGKDVKLFRKEDRVVTSFWQNWPGGELKDAKSPQMLGGHKDGVLADYVVLNESGLVKIPDCLSYAEAAAIPCAGVTAWQALVVKGNIKAGDWVLLLGTGGVSLFALQFAKMHSAKTILLSSSEEKLRKIEEIGADFTINYKETKDWPSKIKKLTSGGGVDHIIEVGGPSTFQNSLESASIGGNINIIGYRNGQEGTANPLSILRHQLEVRAIAVGPTSSLEQVMSAYIATEQKPPIHQIYNWDCFQEALNDFSRGKHIGKIVLEKDN
ncbi:MAG: NAD(P)-dependent alcohol dehydrogenase [Marinobacter sp.]|nr:NAD(P)-dependent alcohol dehydrogenase [Marinobacter sp.]